MSVKVAIRVPAQRAYLLVLIDALVRLNRLLIRQMPRLPTIYESGVRYKREGRDRQGNRIEDWRTVVEILQNGGGDCEDLVGYRVAENLEKKIACRPWLRKRGRMWHVLVRYPDGRIEDPSLKLGMGSGD